MHVFGRCCAPVGYDTGAFPHPCLTCGRVSHPPSGRFGGTARRTVAHVPHPMVQRRLQRMAPRVYVSDPGDPSQSREARGQKEAQTAFAFRDGDVPPFEFIDPLYYHRSAIDEVEGSWPAHPFSATQGVQMDRVGEGIPRNQTGEIIAPGDHCAGHEGAPPNARGPSCYTCPSPVTQRRGAGVTGAYRRPGWVRRPLRRRFGGCPQ
jgi:hypothetical protein